MLESPRASRAEEEDPATEDPEHSAQGEADPKGTLQTQLATPRRPPRSTRDLPPRSPLLGGHLPTWGSSD